MQKRRLPPRRWLQGAAAVQGRELQVPGRQHHRHAHRPDHLAGLPRQALRGHPGGLHRADAEGHAATSSCPAGVAGLQLRRRGRPPSIDLVPRVEAPGHRGHRRADPRGRLPDRRATTSARASRGPSSTSSNKLDKAVDLVVSGHTHRAYNCRIDGRLVTSADKYGTLISEIDLVLDPKSGDVTQRPGRQRDRAHRSLRQGCGADQR